VHAISNLAISVVCSISLIFVAFYDPDSPQIHRVGGYLQKQTSSWLSWSHTEGSHNPSAQVMANLEAESLHVNYSEAVSYHDTGDKPNVHKQRQRPLCWRKPRDEASCPANQPGHSNFAIHYSDFPITLAKKLHQATAVLTFDQCRPATGTEWLVSFPWRTTVFMELITLCNVSPQQEQAVGLLLKQLQWPTLSLAFDHVVCGSNVTTKRNVPLLLLADERSQHQLAAWINTLTQRLQHATGLTQTNMIVNRNAWHVRLGNVDISSCSIRKLLDNMASLIPPQSWTGPETGARTLVQHGSCAAGHCSS
jgi:hypothetical protein